MPIKEAGQYIPEDGEMHEAYALVKRDHFKALELMQDSAFEDLQAVAGDFFTAGVAYLANFGHDKHIKEVGEVMWWSVNQQQTLVAMTDNMIGAAIQLGVPLQIALTTYSKSDEPHVLFAAEQVRGVSKEVAFVLVPPEFIQRAVNTPVEALATMAWIGSQVRDMVNGRLYIDQQYINTRAAATEAHFLKEAVKRYPELELAGTYAAVLKHFPFGIDSLPKVVKYRGIHQLGLKNIRSN